MENKLTFIDSEGKEEKYDIIAKFTNGVSNFIAFTKKEQDNEKSDLLVLKYDFNSGDKTLMPIEDSEKEFVESYLKKYIFSEE